MMHRERPLRATAHAQAASYDAQGASTTATANLGSVHYGPPPEPWARGGVRHLRGKGGRAPRCVRRRQENIHLVCRTFLATRMHDKFTSDEVERACEVVTANVLSKKRASSLSYREVVPELISETSQYESDGHGPPYKWSRDAKPNDGLLRFLAKRARLN